MTSKTLTFNALIVIIFVLLWNGKNHFKTHAFQEILPSKTFKKTNKQLLPKPSLTCHDPSLFLLLLKKKNIQSTTTAIFFYGPSTSSSFKSLSNNESKLILNQSTKRKKSDTTNNNKEDEEEASNRVPTTFFKPAQSSTTRKSHKQYPKEFDQFIQETINKYKNDDLVDVPKLIQNKQSWWTQFKELYQYFLKRGHSNVPNGWKKNIQFADWVRMEREWYRTNQQDLLPTSNFTSILSNNNYQFYFNNTHDQTRYVLLNEIQFQWVIQPKYSLKPLWLERYNELCEYVDEHGNANVPIKYEHNPKLANWVMTQRKWYKQDYPKEKMNLDSNVTDLYLKACVAQQRVDLLESFGFQWSLQKRIQFPINCALWYERLEQLKQYKQQFGHTNVPQQWETNKSLGNWVDRQRKWYRRLTNKDGKLIEFNKAHQERIDLMNEIGFEWKPGSNKELDNVWVEMYNQLLEYHAENGHCNVPNIYPPNPQLGKWVQNQRTWHSNVIKRGIKQQEEIDELANVIQGKKGRDDLDDPFINNSTSRIGCYLGQDYIQKRIELLNDIEFNWTVLTGPTWQDRYDELLEFKKEYGHTNVPYNWKQNKKLGGWIKWQREWYKMNTDGNGDLLDSKDPIKSERINLMNKIGFRWRLTRSSSHSKIHPPWMGRYNELCDYVNRFGHANVPRAWIENVKLSIWVDKQRTNYKKMKQNGLLKIHQVMQQKVKLLNKIGFKWYVAGNSYWWLMYNKLIIYMEQNNNGSLSGLATSSYIRQDLQLYQFVYRLRQHVKEYIAKVKQKGTTIDVKTKYLDNEKVEALRRINFSWLPKMEKGKDGSLSVLCLDDEPIDGDDIMGWSREEVKEFESIDLESLALKESSIEGNLEINEIVSNNNGQIIDDLDNDNDDDDDDKNDNNEGEDYDFDWRSTD